MCGVESIFKMSDLGCKFLVSVGWATLQGEQFSCVHGLEIGHPLDSAAVVVVGCESLR